MKLSWSCWLSATVMLFGVAGCPGATVGGASQGSVDEIETSAWGDVTVTPSVGAFGLVCAGDGDVLTLEIANQGDGALEVTDIQLSLDSSDAFTLAGPPATGTYAPGEAHTCDIAYSPSGAAEDLGTLLVYTSDQVAPLEIPLTGSPGGPDLLALPAVVDFGGVPAGDVGIQTVDLYNNGAGALTLVSIELASDWPAAVLWIDALDVWKPLPWAVEPGEFVTLGLALAPQFFSWPTETPLGSLEILSTDCHDAHSTVEIYGWPGGTDVPCEEGGQPLTESFVGKAALPTDVLFVVDNSESMLDEQKKLAGNFASFIQSATDLAIDYRIAVTTTDMDHDKGALHGAHPVVTPATWTEFMANVIVGTDGSLHEQGIEAAHSSLTRDAGFKPWLRDDAKLVIIFVSDEVDQSSGSVKAYYETFVDLKGGVPSRVLAHAIVGPEHDGCDTANTGARYLKLAGLSGGSTASICEENWGETMLDFGDATFATRTMFQLASPAFPESVSVQVDGVACDAGWALQPDALTVKFGPTAACLPEEGQPVEITYEPICR